MNIILTHGLLGFDTLPVLHVDYFNGIREHLESRFQARVLVAQVPPVRGIDVRGDELKREILKALGQTGTPPVLDPEKKVHIIAHSMGGLDGRYLLSPANPGNIADRVCSLTTIGTPHQGSPLADLCESFADGESKIPLVGTIEEVIRGIADKFHWLDGLHDLTAEPIRKFNDTYIDNPRLNYFCVAGSGRAGSLKTSKWLLPAYGYLAKVAGGENDGMVPVSSALRVGWEAITPPWPADHFDEIGHDLDKGLDGKPAHFDYLHGYEEIVERLRNCQV
jgi:triacylglycerol lipase